jgi:DNA-binding response OmpR family regulator
MMKVLLIEDSVRLRESIQVALKKSGYAVDVAGDGEQGLWLAESGSYDVIILDLMLPKIDGISLLAKLREKGVNTHVLLLTAKDRVEDRVGGLDAGADDYLTKPFSLDELLARVAALVRRCYGQKSPKVQVGNLELSVTRQEMLVGGKALPLAPREYKVLEFLIRRAGSLVVRSDIEDHIYEESSEIFSNVIDSTISILRRKMTESGCTSSIHTRRGRGYILEASAE